MTEDIDLEVDPVLSTTEVGELFDVHASTVKRWCDRGELDFGRTQGGHRRIPLSQVLRRARETEASLPLLDFGERAGAVWHASQAARERDFRATRHLALELLGSDELQGMSDLFRHQGRDRAVDLHGLLDDGLRPVMTEVGERWERGAIGPGTEHMVSEVVADLLHRLRATPGTRGAAARSPASVALVGAVEGERHALGARCVRVALERAGWEVRFLGPDVPMEEWATLQRAYGARLVGVSFSRMRSRADLLRCTRRLAEAYDAAHPYVLALGGGARVDGPPEGPWPFTAVRFFPGVTPFASWLGEADGG